MLVCNKGNLHTRNWEPVTITLQALSLMEKAEPIQVHCTLCSRDRRSMWMQYYLESTWIPTWHQMDHVSWSLGLLSKPPLGGTPNPKPGDHGTPQSHNYWFIIIIMCEDILKTDCRIKLVLAQKTSKNIGDGRSVMKNFSILSKMGCTYMIKHHKCCSVAVGDNSTVDMLRTVLNLV